jgi:eukaryotic-like serine/threonine-protein kinase
MNGVKRTRAPRKALSIAAPQAGQIIGERYQLEEWLESGAMGEVWRAQQVRLRSPAAIKFLEPSLIEVSEMLERFLQEARSAAAVQSPHVVQVFDYGNEGGLPYIAMEFLKGENLDARLARLGRLTPAELDKIFSEVASGLGQAHALGVIHRDVKPANIFLAQQGTLEVTKLIDFGIAKVKADALRLSQIVGTEHGALLGTPQYMSPEQILGRGSVDSRSDLWALAIIACECLVGRYPFSATTLGDLTLQICTEKPLSPSTLGEVPAGFDQWFFKGTHKQPDRRFDSAAEMAAALTKVLAPREPAPASIHGSVLLVLPSALTMRRAWLATCRRLVRAWAGALDRAWARGSTATSRRLRTTVHKVRKTFAEAGSRPGAQLLWLRSGAVGLALLLVAGGLLLFRSELRPGAVAADVTAHAAAVSPALRAVLPNTPLPAAPATLPAPPDPGTQPALPLLTPEPLPRAPLTVVPSASAKKAEARRRGKRRPPASSGSNAAGTPSSPRSSAMLRLNALLAKGKQHPARPAPAASGPARARAKPEKN